MSAHLRTLPRYAERRLCSPRILEFKIARGPLDRHGLDTGKPGAQRFRSLHQTARAQYPDELGGPYWNEPGYGTWREAIYKDWYTSPLVKFPWSCDWDLWCGLRWFTDGRVQTNYNTAFKLPGTIEPLAFMEAGSGTAWIFTAGGRYYFYDDETDVVLRFEREFASHDEFVEWQDREWTGEHCEWTTELPRRAPHVFEPRPLLHSLWRRRSNRHQDTKEVDHENVRPHWKFAESGAPTIRGTAIEKSDSVAEQHRRGSG
ncbi:hypothetical protein FB451DRAFT_1369809 [Mycena latifolia]|nr:hypothetical protein FB451DRAFT_1369809 [Mycena latifolia]